MVAALGPSLLMLIGLPGSGKTTVARRLLQAQIVSYVISTDTIRARLFGSEAVQGPWLKVWAEVERQFLQASAGLQASPGPLPVLYDATNAVRRNRREAIALARQSGFVRLYGLWCDVPLTVCLERNRGRDRRVPDEVIEQMARSLQGAPPNLSDGFDGLARQYQDAPFLKHPLGVL